MDPKEFLQTIYLGDRACKGVLIDSWNHQIAIQIDRISRIRSATGNWDYYADEDIVDGELVFSGAESIILDPPGLLPNDYINSIDATRLNDERHPCRYLFEIRVGYVNKTGESQEVLIHVIATGIHLSDPARPGMRITE